jgi:hypothetical protein
MGQLDACIFHQAGKNTDPALMQIAISAPWAVQDIIAIRHVMVLTFKLSKSGLGWGRS